MAAQAGDLQAYLAGQQEKELLRFLTAGSVDDGKSTLIGRLLHDTKGVYEDQLAAVRRDSERHGHAGGEVDLSLLVDGLKAEREQGITIDVAYRYFSTAKRKFIIADCPGHEQYTRNMATGASSCSLAIILVDARHGIQAQTRRHSFIVSVLGIRHVVVAVNKMDAVGWSEEVFERIRDEYAAFAARLEFTDVRFIPLSALRGDNVVEPSANMPWYHGDTLLYLLEHIHVASDQNLIDLRFPVQYVSRAGQDFRGFSGTLASGVVHRGDEIMAMPSGRRSRVARVIGPSGDLDAAPAPMAITLTLADEIDVSRGDMLVHPGNLPQLTREWEAMVVWMSDQPLAEGRGYLLKLTTNLVGARVAGVHYKIDVNTLERQPGSGLAMNEIGRCTIVANRPLPHDAYANNRATGAFILIDRQSNLTLAAGMILDRRTSAPLLPETWSPVDGLTSERGTAVSEGERAARFGQRPATILLTGLAGSGKRTLAYALERRLFDAGHTAVVLDGANLRRSLSRDLGYADIERAEHLRRAAAVAKVINDAGLICICPFIAPSAETRARMRDDVGESRFLEVQLDAPIDVCRARDAAGVYDRSASGDVEGLPGVDAPYEPAAEADATLDTDAQSVDESVDALVRLLELRGFLTP